MIKRKSPPLKRPSKQAPQKTIPWLISEPQPPRVIQIRHKLPWQPLAERHDVQLLLHLFGAPLNDVLGLVGLAVPGEVAAEEVDEDVA